MRKIIVLVILVSFAIKGQTQTSINDYKYVVLPLKFDFLKEKDQYRVNTLTRFLLKSEGFEVYFDEQKPPIDLAKNRCLALYADVEKLKGGLFKTKVEILFKDCFGNLILRSRTGESRDKDYDKAYPEALKHAFESFKNLDYKYVPKHERETAEIKSSTIETEDAKLLKKEDIKLETVEVVDDSILKEELREEISENKVELFYAQSTENGYQLVNSEPKIVMILLSSAAKNVFIVKDKNAIVYKEDDFWYYSENNGSLSEKKQLTIKF